MTGLLHQRSFIRKLLTIKVEVHIDKNHLFQFSESFSIKGRDVEKVFVIPGTKKAVQQNSGEKIINSTCSRKKIIKPTCSRKKMIKPTCSRNY